MEEIDEIKQISPYIEEVPYYIEEVADALKGTNTDAERKKILEDKNGKTLYNKL